MSMTQDALQRLSSCLKQPSTLFCRHCLTAVRRYSTAIEKASIQPAATERFTLASHEKASSHSVKYKIKTAVLLSRPPLLTRDPTAFEKSHYLYQRRMNERLAIPFSRYFYYQKGTPGDVEWKRKMQERITPAREIGSYNGYGSEAWNDELLVGDMTSEPAVQVEKLLKDVEVETKVNAAEELKREKMERPSSRRTQADEKGDKTSLNRLLTRTLYLLVKRKGGNGRWIFPENDLLEDESLHRAAERVLVQTGGINMNTWVVGNMPVGHQVYHYSKPHPDEKEEARTIGEKMFFMKARIMAGKPDLKESKFDLVDHQWLMKEEIKHIVEPRDWSVVKNVLAER